MCQLGKEESKSRMLLVVHRPLSIDVISTEEINLLES